MEWYQLAQNPQAILQLYTTPPTLQGVRLMEIVLNQDEPRLRLRADLNQFADKPPMRWVRDGYNTVQLHLSCVEPDILQLRGWSRDNIVDLRITQEANGRIRLSTYDSPCEFTVVCDFFNITRLAGYIQRDPGVPDEPSSSVR